jgi:hypothetical protein
MQKAVTALDYWDRTIHTSVNYAKAVKTLDFWDMAVYYINYADSSESMGFLGYGSILHKLCR